MIHLSSIYVPVEGDAFHAIADRIARIARRRAELRRLERAELSPPRPWLLLPAPASDVPAFAHALSSELDEVVLGLVADSATGTFGFWRFDSGREERTPEPWQADVVGRDVAAATAAVVAHYDLPRFSDHKLRIGPAWPFRRWELFWSLLASVSP